MPPTDCSITPNTPAPRVVAPYARTLWDAARAEGVPAAALAQALGQNAPGEDELRRMLTEAIEELSEQERTVLSLYYYENLTMKEIGQVMGVSEQRIGQVNRKLVQKLREKLTAYMKG